MSVVMEAPSATTPLPLFAVQIEVPKRPLTEPRVAGMSDLVKQIRAIVEQRGSVEVPMPACPGLYSSQGDSRVRDRKVQILQEVAAGLEGSRREAFFTLFVFGVFRFGLAAKDLGWLCTKTGASLDELRRISEEGRRVWRKR